MKIAVCVKQVPEGNSVKLDPVSHTLIRKKSGNMLNQADLFAVEAAITLKEETDAQLEAITMGPDSAEAVLRDVIAMGADGGTLLSSEDFIGSDTYGTSLVLASALRELGGVDVVFCGARSSDGDTGQTGAFLAAHLGIPYFSRVLSVCSDEEELIITREAGTRKEKLLVKPPVLISVEENANKPRYATLKRLLYSLDTDIRRLDGKRLVPNPKAAAIGRYSPTQVTEVYQERADAAECIFLSEGRKTEAVIDALEGCLKEAGCVNV